MRNQALSIVTQERRIEWRGLVIVTGSYAVKLIVKTYTVQLDLVPPAGHSNTLALGSIFIRLEVSDEMSTAKSNIKTAKKRTERIDPNSTVMKVLGIITKLDEVVKAISSIVAVNPSYFLLVIVNVKWG